MAATIPPSNAFDLVKNYIKKMPLEQVALSLVNAVSNIIWMAAPWRWTLGVMSAVTLVSNQQDYTVTLPNDFLYLIQAYITDGTTSPRHLNVEPILTANVGVVGQPSKIAVIGSTTVRLMPKPGTLPTSPTTQLFLVYKKKAPLFAPADIYTAGALVMDDEWFWVFESGMLWLAYLYADDQRAGSAQADTMGKIQFSGQRAVFEGNIQLMREREKLPMWDLKSAPEPKADRA